MSPARGENYGTLYLWCRTVLAARCFIRHDSFNLLVEAWALRRPSEPGAGTITACLRIGAQQHGGVCRDGLGGLGINFLDGRGFDEALGRRKRGDFVGDFAK